MILHPSISYRPDTPFPDTTLFRSPFLSDSLSCRISRDVVTTKFKAGDMPGGRQEGVGAIAEQIQLTPEEAAARAAAADQAERDRADDGNFGGLFFIGFI